MAFNNMYRIGDCVYFENYTSQSSEEPPTLKPYKIRKIEELTRNSATGTVEAKVSCFYRRFNIRREFVHMADAFHRFDHYGGGGTRRDVKSGGVEEPIANGCDELLLPRDRELFMSNDVEVLPANQIRGKCSVSHLRDILENELADVEERSEQLKEKEEREHGGSDNTSQQCVASEARHSQDFPPQQQQQLIKTTPAPITLLIAALQRENCFFYRDVYSSERAILELDRGVIRVDETSCQFQAELPAFEGARRLPTTTISRRGGGNDVIDAAKETLIWSWKTACEQFAGQKKISHSGDDDVTGDGDDATVVTGSGAEVTQQSLENANVHEELDKFLAVSRSLWQLVMTRMRMMMTMTMTQHDQQHQQTQQQPWQRDWLLEKGGFEILHSANYDVIKALKTIRRHYNTGKHNDEDDKEDTAKQPSELDQQLCFALAEQQQRYLESSERNRFYEGVKRCGGKFFSEIRRYFLPHRSVADLICAYYDEKNRIASPPTTPPLSSLMMNSSRTPPKSHPPSSSVINFCHGDGNALSYSFSHGGSGRKFWKTPPWRHLESSSASTLSHFQISYSSTSAKITSDSSNHSAQNLLKSEVSSGVTSSSASSGVTSSSASSGGDTKLRQVYIANFNARSHLMTSSSSSSSSSSTSRCQGCPPTIHKEEKLNNVSAATSNSIVAPPASPPPPPPITRSAAGKRAEPHHLGAQLGANAAAVNQHTAEAAQIAVSLAEYYVTPHTADARKSLEMKLEKEKEKEEDATEFSGEADQDEFDWPRVHLTLCAACIAHWRRYGGVRSRLVLRNKRHRKPTANEDDATSKEMKNVKESFRTQKFHADFALRKARTQLITSPSSEFRTQFLRLCRGGSTQSATNNAMLSALTQHYQKYSRMTKALQHSQHTMRYSQRKNQLCEKLFVETSSKKQKCNAK